MGPDEIGGDAGGGWNGTERGESGVSGAPQPPSSSFFFIDESMRRSITSGCRRERARWTARHLPPFPVG